ncbi:hypothetical protein HMPREF1982_03038 [Clostridiales bacterium oral taxon 876 str. F0540]|nr:hypothetical protein HMPREF1982_03038 [Clostridiales bacterium oral taxon 876 str. F0540]
MSKIKEVIKRNYELSKKLKAEYQDLYTDIVCYIRTAPLTERQTEEAVNDILDIMLGAQDREEDIFEVIGEDYKEFCDEVIESHKEKNQGIKNLIEAIPLFIGNIAFLIGLDFVSQKIVQLKRERSLDIVYKFHLTPIVLGVIFVLIAVYVIKRIGRTENEKMKGLSKKQKMKSNFLFGMSYSLIIIASVTAGHFIDRVIQINIAFYILIIPILILFMLSKMLSNKYA